MERFSCLVILLGCLLATQGAPVEEPQQPLVITTKMPELGSNTFNRMVGACTYKDVIYDTHRCQRGFYLSYRTKPGMLCSKRFAPLKRCLLKKVKSCFQPVLSASLLQSTMDLYRKSMVATMQYSCGLKRYRVSDFLKQKKLCAGGFEKKLDQCPSKFFEVFQKNPGSLELCGAYDKHQRCMETAITTMCTIDFTNSTWIFGKEINPFCDEQQVKALEVQNDHDDHYHHDDDHDHDDDDDEHDHDHRDLVLDHLRIKRTVDDSGLILPVFRVPLFL